MLIAMCPVRIMVTCVLFSAGSGDGKRPRFNSTIFASFFRAAPPCLLQYHSYDAFTDPQNASDPSFYPYVMFIVLFLAVCRRLAVILVRKVRQDGSSTVGNSCCGVKSIRRVHEPPKCIRSFVSSILDVSYIVSGCLLSFGCHFGLQGSFGRIVHGRQQLVLRREKHPILRYVHAGLPLDVGRRQPIF
jgi:hypothetical protein